jgi:hypothetical protein
VIDACDHKRRALKRVLRLLDPLADAETPDLRPRSRRDRAAR